METGAYFDQSGELPSHVDPAARGLHDVRDELEDGALARSIGADNSEGFAAIQLETYLSQCPEFLGRCRRRTSPPGELGKSGRDQVPKRIVPFAADEPLRDILHTQDNIGSHYMFSAKAGSQRLKK